MKDLQKQVETSAAKLQFDQPIIDGVPRTSSVAVRRPLAARTRSPRRQFVADADTAADMEAVAVRCSTS